MARLNVEDSLWADQRFIQLCIKTGDMAKAVGAVLLAFKLAQRFWVPDKRNIPSVQFRSTPLASDMIEVGLAEYVDGEDFVYVKGTEEQFAWLIQRSKAGSSKKQRPLKSLNNLANGTKRDLTGSNGMERNETSYSFSYSPSSSSSISSSESSLKSKKEKKPKTIVDDPDKSGSVVNKPWLIFNAYSEAFESRYKQKPIQNQRQFGLCKQISSRLGDLAEDVVRFYLSHNDGFYLKSQHPLNLLVRDCEGLAVQMQRGRAVTSSDVRAFERSNQYDSLIAEIESQIKPKGTT